MSLTPSVLRTAILADAAAHAAANAHFARMGVTQRGVRHQTPAAVDRKGRATTAQWAVSDDLLEGLTAK